jgi:hypothetical protein
MTKMQNKIPAKISDFTIISSNSVLFWKENVLIVNDLWEVNFAQVMTTL